VVLVFSDVREQQLNHIVGCFSTPQNRAAAASSCLPSLTYSYEPSARRPVTRLEIVDPLSQIVVRGQGGEQHRPAVCTCSPMQPVPIDAPVPTQQSRRRTVKARNAQTLPETCKATNATEQNQEPRIAAIYAAPDTLHNNQHNEGDVLCYRLIRAEA
jgi:hypothetical protein